MDSNQIEAVPSTEEVTAAEAVSEDSALADASDTVAAGDKQLPEEPAATDGDVGEEAEPSESIADAPDSPVVAEAAVPPDDDGEELPFVQVPSGLGDLTEKFTASGALLDDLRRAEQELAFLRQQVRHQPESSAAVQELQQKLDYVASGVFDLSEKLAEVSKTVALFTPDLQKVSDETGQMLAWTAKAKVSRGLSVWFQIVSIMVLVALLAGMGYLAVNQLQLQQRQDKVSALAVHAAEEQEKRMAEFDRHFSELVGSEIKGAREAAEKDAAMTKLNRLRNGAAEQRLLRRSSGDWLLPQGKTEQPITDHEVIQLLNQAFEKSGRSLAAVRGMPPHTVVSVLKADGKGGSEVVVTREALP